MEDDRKVTFGREVGGMFRKGTDGYNSSAAKLIRTFYAVNAIELNPNCVKIQFI